MTAPRWDEAGPVAEVISHLGSPAVLSVDPERIDELVGRLQAVAQRVMELEREVQSITVASPATDEVSINSASQAARMLERSSQYLATWRMSVVVAAEALQRQAEAYRGADMANVSRA